METHGRPPRCPGWDYERAGAYFVTLTVRAWVPWFRVMASPREGLTIAGAIVQATWSALPEMFPRVRLDEMVIMPEHVHAVMILRDASGSPTPLGEVVRYWKGVTRTKIKVEQPEFRWRVGFYDRIIRSQRTLTVVRRYIQQNPANYKGPWAQLPAKPPSTS